MTSSPKSRVYSLISADLHPRPRHQFHDLDAMNLGGPSDYNVPLPTTGDRAQVEEAAPQRRLRLC